MKVTLPEQRASNNRRKMCTQYTRSSDTKSHVIHFTIMNLYDGKVPKISTLIQVIKYYI